MNMLALRMEARELRCCVYKSRIATERSHPRGPFWETGTGLKAHDFFAIPVSIEAHLEYHRDIEAFEIAHGTHAELLKAFWRSIGFVPGEWMLEGMPVRRADWLKRVLHRLA